jgi:putative NADH-flavin reductase
MKVVIFGASKGIGLATVRRALDAGYQVRAFARSASTIPDAHPNLEKVDGDALDPKAVRAAIGPDDVVIQALGISLTPQNVIRPITLFSDATRILVDAMKEIGATRLICVTGFGAGDSAGRGGFFYQAFGRQGLLKRAYDDKDIQEWIIRRSGLDWTIARPGILTDGPQTGRYQVLTDAREWRVGKIARANVADFLVQQIASDAHICDTPVLIE